MARYSGKSDICNSVLFRGILHERHHVPLGLADQAELGPAGEENLGPELFQNRLDAGSILGVFGFSRRWV